jgi:membrane protease YdiL (CAAX protease family)
MTVDDQNKFRQDQELPSQSTPEPEIWHWKDVLLISSGIIVIFLVIISGYRLFTQIIYPQETTSLETSLWVSLSLGLLEGVILIGCVYYLGIRRRGYSWEDVGLRIPTPGWITRGILLGALVIPLSGLIALFIQLLLGQPLTNPQIPFLAPEGFTWFGAVGMLVFGGIIAPFAEELYFRGVLYAWLRQRRGVWIAMFISSLLFGLLHGEASIAGAAFVLGMILAWTYERSNSLLPPVLIHIINNSFKIILLYGLLAAGLSPT